MDGGAEIGGLPISVPARPRPRPDGFLPVAGRPSDLLPQAPLESPGFSRNQSQGLESEQGWKEGAFPPTCLVINYRSLFYPVSLTHGFESEMMWHTKQMMKPFQAPCKDGVRRLSRKTVRRSRKCPRYGGNHQGFPCILDGHAP